MKRTNPLGKNNAEEAIGNFRAAAGILTLTGAAWLLMRYVFGQVELIDVWGIYFAVITGVAALLALAASFHTQANNSLFRDRDEMMSSIRILEAERRDMRARREQGQRFKTDQDPGN